jgi:hypothetical protein
MSVRQNVRSAKRPSAKCPFGKMSFGKMSFGKVSFGKMSGHRALAMLQGATVVERRWFKSFT